MCRHSYSGQPDLWTGQSEGIRRVIKGLGRARIETQLDALWCSINITADTNSRYTESLIEYGALVSSAHKKFAAQAMWVLSNIAGKLFCIYHHYISFSGRPDV